MHRWPVAHRCCGPACEELEPSCGVCQDNVDTRQLGDRTTAHACICGAPKQRRFPAQSPHCTLIGHGWHRGHRHVQKALSEARTSLEDWRAKAEALQRTLDSEHDAAVAAARGHAATAADLQEQLRVRFGSSRQHASCIKCSCADAAGTPASAPTPGGAEVDMPPTPSTTSLAGHTSTKGRHFLSTVQ